MLKQLLNCETKPSNRYTTSDLKKYSKFETYQMHLFKKHMEYGRKKHPTWSDLKYFSRMRMWYVHRGYMYLYSWFMKFEQPMFNYGLLTEYEYKEFNKIKDILNGLMTTRHDQYTNLKQSRFDGTEMMLPYNTQEIVDVVLGGNKLVLQENLQF